VSGHRSWASLKRYTHIRQTGDKWAGAGWLKKVTRASGELSRELPQAAPREP
jgi:hypothetical protein